MSFWDRWLRRPKSLWLRRAIFQIHLWTGIALGLYVLVISVTGSALVFRNELYNSLWPGPRIVDVTGPRLTHDQLRDAARRVWPRYKVTWIWDSRSAKQAPNQAIEIWFERNGHKKERLFDPYTGRDLGESRPYTIQLLAWLGDLHINLLAGDRGRIVNGVGAMFVVMLSATGAVVWWPGVRSWRRGIAIRGGSNWKRLTWDLHSVVGLWMLPMVFVFGVVGIYAGFPRPFQVAINKFEPLNIYRLDPDTAPLPPPGMPFARPKPSTGDKIVRWFSYLHFGNFGGWPSKAIWTILGLVPGFLFVTGALIWWNRVLSPTARKRYIIHA
jgi:uncharacterized iron-regulated membrane protein